RFRIAIDAEYKKDEEYQYRHVATLSGGLDSRMTVMSAVLRGYKELHTITMSQRDYLDECIAKQIATKCGVHALFYALNGGEYLRDVLGPVAANDGLVLYSGAAHLYRLLSLLNWSQFGLLHTGMLGDVVLGGTYLSQPKHLEAGCSGAYSTKLLSRI